jgi:hypothetical protein
MLGAVLFGFALLAVKAPASCHVHESAQPSAHALRAGLSVTMATRIASQARDEAVGLGEGQFGG